ncbi:MAG: methylated-DNA--[protein]-cysteine S-methyltransferase [Actinomycetota bacterium]|nr:methylated-DNA--[protein]-cysteine S-methyltransferase [Actinomycetota bacterium]
MARDSIERTLSAGRRDLKQAAADMSARFAERAAAEGAAKVAYAQIDTPIGRASVAATDRGVVSLGLPNRALDDFLAELADDVSPRIVEAPAALDEVRRELAEYFAGGRETFNLALDWQLVPGGFYRKVLRATARLPFGTTATYGEIAGKAGNPRAHRAAGTALGSNPLPIVVPCHRIVRSGGDPGNYGGGAELKRWLLELEGALSEG